MNKQDAMKLIYVIKSTYPKHFQNFGINDISQMADAWEFHLGDYSYEQMSMGLKVYSISDTKGFPPSPGQVIDCYLRTLKSPEEELTAAEAWEYVWKAMENLRWDEPELEFNKLPKRIQKVIGTASSLREMASMDMNDLMIGEKARFIHEYNAYTERENDYMRLPQTVRDRIGQNGTNRLEMLRGMPNG